MVSLVTSVSSSTPGSRAPVNVTGQPISSGTLNTGPTSAVSTTNMLHGSMTAPGSSSLLSTALSSDPATKNSIMAASSQPETQTQNALLKQLLSSTPTPKSSSDTSPVKTSFSLEAQLDQHTDNIEKDEKYNTTKPTLSSLASQIPNPQGSANQAASPTPGQTKVTQAVGQSPTMMAPPSMLQGSPAPPVSNPGSYIAQQSSSGGSTSITSPPPMATSTPTKVETSPASMSEGLAGHLATVAKLPTQPVPETSLAGVVQVQPNSSAAAMNPMNPQMQRMQGPASMPMTRPPGGIQNLLQSQVPVPQGQLPPGNPMMQQQQQQQQQGMMQQQQAQPRQMMPQQMQQQMVQPQQQMQQQQRMQMQHPVSQMGNPQMIQQQGPMMSQQMQQQQHQLQQQRMQHEQLRQQQLQHMQQMQQQRMQHGGPGFEPPQQVVSLQNRMPMGPGGQFGPHMAGGPRPMGAMQQMMNQVSQPMIRQQMGMGGRMPGMPGHPAVTAGLRLNIPPQQMGSGAPGTPNSALPSPALTPRSEHDDMDTGSSRGPTPGSDKMDGSITPDLNDPNKLKRRPSQPQAGQKRRISANDGVGAKKRPRKGSRVDDGDYDNYIDTVMHQLKNLPPMSTVEPKLSHCFNACGVYGIGDVPKLMSKDIDIHKGPLEGKFGNSSLSTEGDYYSTMPFGPEPPVPYIPPVSCSQRGFYQQEFMQERRPEIPRMDGYISPDLFCSSSPEPNPEEERRKRKKRIEKRKVVRAREKAEALKEAEKKKAEQEAREERKKRIEKRKVVR